MATLVKGVACSRMYDVSAGARQGWRRLFDNACRDADIAVRHITHDGDITDLWSRPDLACAFMCGRPFAQSAGAVVPLATIVPASPRNRGEATYCTDFVVRAEDSYQCLEDTFGSILGWTAEHSQSGYAAVLDHLNGLAGADGRSLYRGLAGPLVSPGGALDALKRRAADVVPVDGFFMDLLRKFRPGDAAQVRVLESTGFYPFPPLVASARMPRNTVERLRNSFARMHESEPAIMADMGVARFVPVDEAAYLPLKAAPNEGGARYLSHFALSPV